MQYPKQQNIANGLGALRIIKISLLIFLLGMCVVNKRKSTWPIVSWALYSEYSARFRSPQPTVTDWELKVFTAGGQEHIVKPEHILTVPRDSLSYDIVEQAFSGTDEVVKTESRQYLVRSLNHLLRPDTNIERVQAWETTYAISPLSVPPYQSTAPTKTVMLGSFSLAELPNKS